MMSLTKCYFMVLTTVFNRPSKRSQTFWEMVEARRVIQLSGWSIVQSQQIYPELRAAGEGKNTNLKSKEKTLVSIPRTLKYNRLK